MNRIIFIFDIQLIPKYSKLFRIDKNTISYQYLRTKIDIISCHRFIDTDFCLLDIVIKIVVYNADCCRRNNISAETEPIDFF